MAPRGVPKVEKAIENAAAVVDGGAMTLQPRCAGNAFLLQFLMEYRALLQEDAADGAISNQNYILTLRRASQSVQECPTLIMDEKQAKGSC